MNPYVNEDVMFQRLKDVQRESENRRLMGASPSGLGLARKLGSTLWSAAGSAIRSAMPRRHSIAGEDQQTAKDAA
jgi:hypothetical protein